jgi:phosphatidylserine/phosphatidylglycerophosphate/cardiolipin synthase-like enzyme
MGHKEGKIEFYTGPKEVGAPDNLEEVVISFLDAAHNRLEIAVRELESVPIAGAIIRARERGVLVKLVLEQDYLKADRIQKNPWVLGGKNENNRQIHSAILRAKIDVKCDYNTHIFHQKFIIRDRSSVLTGSTNFTPNGYPQQPEPCRHHP